MCIGICPNQQNKEERRAHWVGLHVDSTKIFLQRLGIEIMKVCMQLMVITGFAIVIVGDAAHVTIPIKTKRKW